MNLNLGTLLISTEIFSDTTTAKNKYIKSEDLANHYRELPTDDK